MRRPSVARLGARSSSRARQTGALAQPPQLLFQRRRALRPSRARRGLDDLERALEGIERQPRLGRLGEAPRPPRRRRLHAPGEGDAFGELREDGGVVGGARRDVGGADERVVVGVPDRGAHDRAHVERAISARLGDRPYEPPRRGADVHVRLVADRPGPYEERRRPLRRP